MHFLFQEPTSSVRESRPTHKKDEPQRWKRSKPPTRGHGTRTPSPAARRVIPSRESSHLSTTDEESQDDEEVSQSV